MKTRSSLLRSGPLDILGRYALVAIAVYLAFPEVEHRASRCVPVEERDNSSSLKQRTTLPQDEPEGGRFLASCLPPLPAAGDETAGGPTSGPSVSVKDFGAKGDGRSDDYEALKAAAAYICSHPGQTLVFPAGVYRVARYKIEGGPKANKVTNIVYDGCRNVTISGAGAKIDVDGDFHRDADYAGGSGKYYYSYTNQVIPFEFRNSSNFTLTGFELNGNADKATRDAKVVESPNHGVFTSNCSSYTISNLHVHHFLTDGIDVGHDRKADRNVVITGVTSTHNARDGLTVGQVRGIQVLSSAFQNNGRTEGQYGNHAPSAGIDIEPNVAPPRTDVETGDVVVQKCRFEDNLGIQLVCNNANDVESVDLKQCAIKALSPDDYRIAFLVFPANGTVQECTFDLASGHSVFLHGLTRSNFSSLKQLIFADNIFNLGHNEGILSDPWGLDLNIHFQGNTVNVSGPAGDRSHMKLRCLAVVTGNTFYFDARGYSGAGSAGQFVILYDGTQEVEGNTYRTNLSGAGKAFRVAYPRVARVANEKYSSNFSR